MHIFKTIFILSLVLILLLSACSMQGTINPTAVPTSTPPPPTSIPPTKTSPPPIPTAAPISRTNSVEIITMDPPLSNGVSASDPVSLTVHYSLLEYQGVLQVWFERYEDDHCTTLGFDDRGNSTLPGGAMLAVYRGSHVYTVTGLSVPPFDTHYVGVGVRIWNRDMSKNLSEDLRYTWCYAARAVTAAIPPVIRPVPTPSSGGVVIPTDTPVPYIPPPDVLPPAVGTINIGGVVYADNNSAGGHGTDEPGLPGYTLVLSDSTCLPVLNITDTDANGDYSFTGLVPGNYCVILQYSGPSPVWPSLAQWPVLISTGWMNASFGIQPVLPPPPPPPPVSTGSISGIVFRDTNQNGSKESDEPAVVGVLVYISPYNSSSGCGSTIVSLTLDSSGFFTYADLSEGQYCISLTDAESGGTIRNFNVVSGSDSFYWYPLYPSSPPPPPPPPPSGGSISGVFFRDTNLNSVLDPGEPLVSDLRVEVIMYVNFLCDGPSIGSTMTDLSGYFTFQDLAEAPYCVRFYDPATPEFTGFIGSAVPGADDFRNVPLTP